MDFFERWFGFSGGRGDGSLEILFLVVLSMITVMLLWYFFQHRSHEPSHSVTYRLRTIMDAARQRAVYLLKRAAAGA
jgi:hypothetical protein